MVRDVFRMAKENAPAIIFIDEVDAIATSRFDAQTGADRYEQMLLCLACCFNTLLCINLPCQAASASAGLGRCSTNCKRRKFW